MSSTSSRSGSVATKERILDAARVLFAQHGFDRTTIRLVAAKAVIHPSLVMRYFGSKEGLFASAAKFELRLPDLVAVTPKKRGEFLAQYLLERWEGPESGDELPALLRVAVTHPEGKLALRRIFEGQLAPVIARVVPKKDAASRAALIATQALGLAFTRYVLELPVVQALPNQQIVKMVGKTFQQYLESR